ncbi:endolytic transglycosylase MltG, partial [Enterococcus faecium]|nr:endolytic transglycosylase MltG [Enterococcus faecium]
MSARLGIVTGKDLAQLTRERTSKRVGFLLWIVAELAIMATDIAEIIGSGIALELLFHIPLIIGILITAADVLILLLLMKLGFRKIEAIVATLVAVILITTFMGYRYYSTSLQPLDAKSNKQIEINIPVGTTSRGVGSILEDKHVVKSGAVFNYYTKSKKINNFQAGYYVLKPSMTLKQIAKKLEKGGAAEPIALNGPRVLIKEGENIDQIANSMKSSKYFKKSDFLKLMKDEDFIKSLAKQYPKLLGSAMKAQNVRYRLEGYLFPASYAIDKNTKLKDVVTQMVAKEDAVLQPYYSKIKSDGLTVQETLSVASLVEMEGSK